jgi:hypothetical protein
MTVSSVGKHHDQERAKGDLEFKFAFLCPITRCPCEGDLSYLCEDYGCARKGGLSPHSNEDFKNESVCVRGLIMAGISTDSYSPYGIACTRCNDDLIAPDWSRYVSECHVRHSWFCERCGHQFETSDYLRLNTQPSEPRRLL